MPLSPPDPVLPTDTVHLSSWFDPVDARTGHDLRSTYVEHFWLPLLGPTTPLLPSPALSSPYRQSVLPPSERLLASV